MFCIECGFKNPERAKFCANCGAQLILRQKPEEKPAEPEKRPAEDPVVPVAPAEKEPAVKKTERKEEPEIEPPFPTDADAPYRRPAAPGSRRARREEAERRQTVEPLESNPAQPSAVRNEQKPAPRPKPVSDEWGSAEDRFRKAFEVEPEKEPEEKPEEEPKPEQKPHTVINSDGETVPEPKRMSASAERRSSTYVPKRNPLTGFDAFLDEETEEDEGAGEKESFLEKHLRSIITLILVLVAALAVVLIIASPAGKKLRFENGSAVSVPASTYAEWGVGYEKEMKYKMAADAYHQALILEPENYDYALKVAENFMLSMDYLQAYKALRVCINLQSGQKVPYQMMREIYPNLSPNEKAEAEELLNDAAHQFGDTALLP